MLLSVVTVTYRRVPLLLRKAASLGEQTLDPSRFEWCVVSNGDPEAAEALAELRTPFALRPLLLERNNSVAAARNAAAAAARGEILLLSDDDVMLPPGCLAAHLLAHGVDPDRANDRVSDTTPEPSVDDHGPSTQRASAAAAPARPRVVIGDLRLPAELEAPSEGGAREPEPFERVASLGRRALWINATGEIGRAHV